MTVIRRYLVLLALSGLCLAPDAALSQFRSEGYDNLVSDPTKQIWVEPGGRESFARRLLDEPPGATVDALAEGTIYALLNDRSGAGPTTAITGGIFEFQSGIVPSGRFRLQAEDASVRLEEIGDLYLTAGGNGRFAGHGRGDFGQTVVYPGVGAQTSYPWNGATGPVREITWVVDPTTDRIQYVQVEFADGGTFRLAGDSGHGWVIDPLKLPPQPKKAAPAPGDPPHIEFGPGRDDRIAFDRLQFVSEWRDDTKWPDDTIIDLPGGARGPEPVLLGRLREVAEAAARILALYDTQGPLKNPALWATISRSRLDAILTGFQQAALEPPKKDVKVEEAKDTTPKPKSKPPGGASSGNIPVPLPGGGTGSAPAGGDGGVTNPDGSVVYLYLPGSSVVSVTVFPPGPSGKRATVTVMGNGSKVVVLEDGTRVEQGPRKRTVILPTGEIVSARRKFGGIYELSVYELTDLGYILFANEYIKAINSEYDTEIPLASIAQLYSNNGAFFPEELDP